MIAKVDFTELLRRKKTTGIRLKNSHRGEGWGNRINCQWIKWTGCNLKKKKNRNVNKYSHVNVDVTAAVVVACRMPAKKKREFDWPKIHCMMCLSLIYVMRKPKVRKNHYPPSHFPLKWICCCCCCIFSSFFLPLFRHYCHCLCR